MSNGVGGNVLVRRWRVQEGFEFLTAISRTRKGCHLTRRRLNDV